MNGKIPKSGRPNERKGLASNTIQVRMEVQQLDYAKRQCPFREKGKYLSTRHAGGGGRRGRTRGSRRGGGGEGGDSLVLRLGRPQTLQGQMPP